MTQMLAQSQTQPQYFQAPQQDQMMLTQTNSIMQQPQPQYYGNAFVQTGAQQQQ